MFNCEEPLLAYWLFIYIFFYFQSITRIYVCLRAFIVILFSSFAVSDKREKTAAYAMERMTDFKMSDI